MKINLYLVKIIHRILRIKRRSVFVNKTNTKSVLISYLLIPQNKILKKFYVKYFPHNNILNSAIIVDFFLEKGYNIYLYDYLDKNPDFSLDYDCFFGHGASFQHITKSLNSTCLKILYLTGAYPPFTNYILKQRMRYNKLYFKTYEQVFKLNINPDNYKGLKISDKLILLGNEFVKNTYPKEMQNKISLINNISNIKYFDVSSNSNTKNFIYMSSIGQVHRGLDLLIRAFSKLPDNNLFVFSNFDSETDFINNHSELLLNSPNIKMIGFVDVNSKMFKSFLKKSSFVILPSASEGQSSSVINLMKTGLIPIITSNTGLPDIGSYGIKIEKLTLEYVFDAINTASNIEDKEYLSLRSKVLDSSYLFEEKYFKNQLGEILSI